MCPSLRRERHRYRRRSVGGRDAVYPRHFVTGRGDGGRGGDLADPEPASVDVAGLGGSVATALLENGLRFVTAAPIEVEGRLWGAMLALESEREALPAGVVNRLESFTELVATAVANATAQSELVAARRRVIEAGDAARERLTRDIHDGAQQRFVNSLINLQRAQQKWVV